MNLIRDYSSCLSLKYFSIRKCITISFTFECFFLLWEEICSLNRFLYSFCVYEDGKKSLHNNHRKHLLLFEFSPETEEIKYRIKLLILDGLLLISASVVLQICVVAHFIFIFFTVFGLKEWLRRAPSFQWGCSLLRSTSNVFLVFGDASNIITQKWLSLWWDWEIWDDQSFLLALMSTSSITKGLISAMSTDYSLIP